uniref:ubiquitin-conjugating enzyme E2 27-like isoform X1 n=1 Tax=Erigeron canadensis TaxID=72917 RepID=UPI001CB8DC2B|nr:ubiquitin-conjugating enzyme E2 27-like isoform X1 [Erigeron canadensis]
MAASTATRVQREISHFNQEKILGMTLMVDEKNIRHLIATIPGPVCTPYEGGIFGVDILLPEAYPFVPPNMRFTTKVWHPNISSQTGAICLDILKNDWSPALNLKTALISLQALLSTPEPNDPQDAVVAKQVLYFTFSPRLLFLTSFSTDGTYFPPLQYLSDHATFVTTARRWTEDYAKASSTRFNAKVQKLVEMGFPEALVKKTLDAVGGDENMALERLCSN